MNSDPLIHTHLQHRKANGNKFYGGVYAKSFFSLLPNLGLIWAFLIIYLWDPVGVS